MALSDFWNGWASARKDVVMVVCGSAAAWMVKKVQSQVVMDDLFAE